MVCYRTPIQFVDHSKFSVRPLDRSGKNLGSASPEEAGSGVLCAVNPDSGESIYSPPPFSSGAPRVAMSGIIAPPAMPKLTRGEFKVVSYMRPAPEDAHTSPSGSMGQLVPLSTLEGYSICYAAVAY